MEFTASGPTAIPLILVGMAVPLIIFVVIPVLIIRGIIKSARSNLLGGLSFSQLRDLTKQFPNNTNWQEISMNWDIRIDPATKRITLTRKPGAIISADNKLPERIQVDSFAQLPATLKKLMPQEKSSQETIISEGIEFTSKETKAPVSVSSTINQPQTIQQNQTNTPQNYELIQTIKKVALIILMLWLFYSFKNYFI